MGFCRTVDFSQFKVRGHYIHSERLGKYFRCMMWLGRIDIPVAGGPWKRCPDDLRFASPRELGTALVLWHLLNASGHMKTWQDMERTISVFVGPTDSLNFGQLSGLLASSGIHSLSDVSDLSTLQRLQADIVQGELGVQAIRSDWFEQPLGGSATYALPQTFTFFGQKFVIDSWALAQTVFSSILWVENGVTNKVQRRVPGALDVAFSVLGNDQVVPELLQQMNGTFPNPDRAHAQAFRDGLPYQHNLAAVRNAIDQQQSTAWNSNIYMQWLSTLRALSEQTIGPEYPEAMRTRAWAMKTLNTQLASWTQLRHDTILYSKPSYTDWGACVYPTGFVEPRPEFWRRLGNMATLAADQIQTLTYNGQYNYVTNEPPQFDSKGGVISEGGVRTNVAQLSEIQQRQVQHLRNFAATVGRLQQLVAKEMTHECFNADEERFLDGLMENSQSFTCTGPPHYSGWYPQLFYRTIYWTDVDNLFHKNFGSGALDSLVADIHTDVPCDACGFDPGSVLHEATGWVNLLMLAVDIGNDRFICAGPVLSHYELDLIGSPKRLSDEEWQPIVNPFRDPASPDINTTGLEGLKPPAWTRSYLVPRP